MWKIRKINAIATDLVKKLICQRWVAQNYIDDRVVGSRHIADAQHIALASVERVDVLVSWNFQHIVNIDRIHAFNSVNLKLGYPMLEIRSPREVIHEKEI